MDFWEEFLRVVVSNGIFAILFVFLFFWQLKDSEKREDAYRETIANLTQHLQTIEQLHEEVKQLKEILENNDNEK